MNIRKLCSTIADPRHSAVYAVLIWVADLVLSIAIVFKVPYTEIDWTAYMQQIQQIIAGELDYMLIKGDTGPLVYPAGHVWIYRALYYFTDNGSDIFKAQVVFLAVYLGTLAVILSIYVHSGLPPFVLGFLILSKRLHSIYLLRLFNDCFVVLAVTLCVLAFQLRRPLLAVIFLSAAVSIKMNALLLVPGAGIILLKTRGFFPSLALAAPMGAVQLAVALPFVQANARSYLHRAFEFTRQFLYKWTVNWRFVPEPVFLSRRFSLSLLAGHLTTLVAFTVKWLRKPSVAYHNKRLVARTLAISNLIGILFARSLHYQFYSWFYWSVPLVLYTSDLPRIFSLIIWLSQEWAWNVYPSTELSSSVVVICLGLMVAGSLTN
jgi:alpha-1,3-mannosyltransferase